MTTAPSTQPPDTEPITSPSPLTAMAAPGSRGPDPSRSTTRAQATRLALRLPAGEVAEEVPHRAITSASSSSDASEWPSTSSST